jgi:hypothetical protein
MWPKLDEARQRSLETCREAFPRPRLAFIVLRADRVGWPLRNLYGIVLRLCVAASRFDLATE